MVACWYLFAGTGPDLIEEFSAALLAKSPGLADVWERDEIARADPGSIQACV